MINEVDQMNYEIQENTELDKLREQLELPDSVELLERREKNELPKHNYETVKLTEGVEVDSRTKEVSHNPKTPFVYTKDYIASDGRYVPSQIKGVYADALENPGYKDIAEDLGRWQMQEKKLSCAVQVQRWIISEENNEEITEKELREIGIEHDWYKDNRGTYISDIGKLAEYKGLKYEHFDNMTMNELIALKQTGVNIMLGVDSHLLHRPSLEKVSADNHAVELIGFDFSDKENPKAIINDPGQRMGRGVAYSMDVFERAACQIDEKTGEKTLHCVTAVYGKESEAR